MVWLFRPSHGRSRLKRLQFDADSGLVHTLEVATTKVADGVTTCAWLHGEEQVVLGDRAYTCDDLATSMRAC